MKNITHFAAVFVLMVSAGFAGSTQADDDDDSEGKRWSDLEGLVFAVKGEFLYDPLGIGAPFVNCYTFHEDLVPEDGLTSGVWDDPLFPELGTWVQHTDRGKIQYTAMANDGAGVSLVQNGTVKGRGRPRLKAYSIVSIDGLGVIAEILTSGRAVDVCPYDL
jgi:hypothetical protein